MVKDKEHTHHFQMFPGVSNSSCLVAHATTDLSMLCIFQIFNFLEFHVKGISLYVLSLVSFIYKF